MSQEINETIYLNYLAERYQVSNKELLDECINLMPIYAYVQDFRKTNINGVEKTFKSFIKFVIEDIFLIIIPIRQRKGKPSAKIYSIACINMPAYALQIILNKGKYVGKSLYVKDNDVLYEYTFDNNIELTIDDLIIDFTGVDLLLKQFTLFKNNSDNVTSVKDVHEEIDIREQVSLQNIIAAMFKMLTDDNVKVENKTQLINYLRNNYEGLNIYGFSKNTLDKHITTAINTFEKSLNGTQDFSK